MTKSTAPQPTISAWKDFSYASIDPRSLLGLVLVFMLFFIIRNGWRWHMARKNVRYETNHRYPNDKKLRQTEVETRIRAVDKVYRTKWVILVIVFGVLLVIWLTYALPKWFGP